MIIIVSYNARYAKYREVKKATFPVFEPFSAVRLHLGSADSLSLVLLWLSFLLLQVLFYLFFHFHSNAIFLYPFAVCFHYDVLAAWFSFCSSHWLCKHHKNSRQASVCPTAFVRSSNRSFALSKKSVHMAHGSSGSRCRIRWFRKRTFRQIQAKAFLGGTCKLWCRGILIRFVLEFRRRYVAFIQRRIRFPKGLPCLGSCCIQACTRGLLTRDLAQRISSIAVRT